MSIQGCAGAEAAAREILSLVQRKLDENQDKPDVIIVLKEIETKAKDIKGSAEAGWY